MAQDALLADAQFPAPISSSGVAASVSLTAWPEPKCLWRITRSRCSQRLSESVGQAASFRLSTGRGLSRQQFAGYRQHFVATGHGSGPRATIPVGHASREKPRVIAPCCARVLNRKTPGMSTRPCRSSRPHQPSVLFRRAMSLEESHQMDGRTCDAGATFLRRGEDSPERMRVSSIGHASIFLNGWMSAAIAFILGGSSGGVGLDDGEGNSCGKIDSLLADNGDVL